MNSQEAYYIHTLIPAAEKLSVRPLFQTDTVPGTELFGALTASHGGILTRSPDVVSVCSASGMDPRSLFFAVAGVPDEILSGIHGSCRYLVETDDDIQRLDRLCGPLLSGGYLEEIAIRVCPDKMAPDPDASPGIPSSGKPLPDRDEGCVQSVGSLPSENGRPAADCSGAGIGTSFTEGNIPRFGRLLRRADNLAVRSVLIPVGDAPVFRGGSAAGDMPFPAGVVKGTSLPDAAKSTFSLVKKLRSDLPCLFHSFCFEGLLQPLAEDRNESSGLASALRMLVSLNDTSLYADFFLS